MAELLKSDDRQLLSRWIGKACRFELLYKISRDGCVASTFHQKCDNKGPTVTVMYNASNSIYGGYLSQSWNSIGNYISDSNAFLFRLQFNGSSSQPVKFTLANTTYAGYGHPSNGPTFGGGHDLKSFSGTVIKSGNTYNLNGGLNIGSSYNSNSYDITSIANGNVFVTDLEVYAVKDGPGKGSSSFDSVLLDEPWRKNIEWTCETVSQLKETLFDYEPASESKVDAANILLIGQIGAGKSSFFNSVNSTFRGKITNKARCGSFEHSLTTVFRKYTIKDHSSGKNMKFRLCDTRGFEDDFLLDAQEIAFILDGNVPDRYQFNLTVPFTPETFGYIRNPTLNDKIHCVAFVVDGSTIDVMSEKMLKQLKDLQNRMNQRNLPQIVLMTKPDKMCPHVNKDVSNTFKSSTVHDTVEKVADVMGLPRGFVLPIKNYERETSLDTSVDILILKAIAQALDFADDYMEEQIEKLAAENEKR